jgi:hypothetical protein
MTVNIARIITGPPAPDLLDGDPLQADEAEPFSAFRRTEQKVQIHWSPTTPFAMSEAADLQVGALGQSRLVEAEPACYSDACRTYSRRVNARRSLGVSTSSSPTL